MAPLFGLSGLAVLFWLAAAVYGDTPANCTYEDVRGKWLFHVSDGGHSNYNINCHDYKVTSAKTMTLEFLYPDVVMDGRGNLGRWTLVYNQGFGFVINGVRYFAFSEWSQKGVVVTSKCHQTKTGWFHDVYSGTYPVANWGCYIGEKIGDSILRQHTVGHDNTREPSSREQAINDAMLVAMINQEQTSWKAGLYEKSNLEEHAAILASQRSTRISAKDRVHPSRPSEETLQQAAALPHEFDWRNVNDVNYVSPVRNQGSCGSCYAFASMGMLEARIRVLSNNTMQPILSTQYVVNCGNYSQGCQGGFPYLVAGQFGVDFGNFEEKCYPYSGTEGKCMPVDPQCERHYTKSFDYIGGFYGDCNEPLMQLNLVKEGPLAVSIMVYKDLQYYKGGIYHHTAALDASINPFEVTNHVVVVVGFGADPKTGEKFWIVKNSWGENWGEKGFFRIRRGTDEVAIESIAVRATPNIDA